MDNIRLNLSSKNMNKELGKRKINNKINLAKLRCDYFLQKVFNNLQKNISLEIVKYNKNIQKRLNININNYKEYSELFTHIEIEIMIAEKKYGKFINIKNNIEYYHIYFDNKKEKITRNYLTKDDKVKKILIIIDYQIKSFNDLFDNCECIESISFNKFYRTMWQYK